MYRFLLAVALALVIWVVLAGLAAPGHPGIQQVVEATLPLVVRPKFPLLG